MPVRTRHVATALVVLLLLLPQPSAAIDYPPRLPDGKPVATFTGNDLLARPATVKDTAVAREPPTVDFLYYPSQTYAAPTWSAWGDGSVHGGVYYSAVGDHDGPRGNAFVHAYDPQARRLRVLTDVASVLDRPPGHYVPGKIHSRLQVGSDGWLYYATHRGKTTVTTDEYHYKGDWVLRTRPEDGRTEVVAHGPVGKQCLPCSVLDPERLLFYGGTQAGDRSDKRHLFFAYDVRDRRVRQEGYGGPSRAIILASSTGRVYFAPDQKGPLHRWDPAEGGSPKAIGPEVGLRAATLETPDGAVYAVGPKDAPVLWRLDVRTEKVERLGSAPVGACTYVTTLDADPTGRFLYYVPGAHGDSREDGAAVVQFDTRTRHKKVVAFLHPALKERFGYTPLGTFSAAVGPKGERLFITWNGNLGGRKGRHLAWEACALTVVHIPESER
ncbi:MAG: hypothetical protein R6X20_18715 [Phycisphaerae bacterium]